MTAISGQNILTSSNGKFSVGMTLDQASKKGLSILKFTKIDKLDGKQTNTLSETDILNEVIEDMESNRFWAVAGTAGAVIAVGAALVCSGPVGWLACAGLFGLGAGICSYNVVKDKEKIKDFANNENKKLDVNS